MSWVSSPRASYAMGDPGLFSFLGKAIGAVANVATGGVAGTLYNTAKALITKRPAPAGPAYTSGPLLAQPMRAPAVPLLAPGGGSAISRVLAPTPIALPGGAIVRADSVKVSGTSIGFGAYQSGQATIYGPQVGAPGASSGAQLVCGRDGVHRVKATHLNKSRYFLKDGTRVDPGTRCVTNRRRNPLNPRALSRAMSRIHGAQKAVRSLIRFESVSRGGKLVMHRPARRRKR